MQKTQRPRGKRQTDPERVTKGFRDTETGGKLINGLYEDSPTGRDLTPAVLMASQAVPSPI